MYVSGIEREAVYLYISRQVKSPFQTIKLEKSSKGIKWKVKARYSEVIEIKKGLLSPVEIAELVKNLRARKY